MAASFHQTRSASRTPRRSAVSASARLTRAIARACGRFGRPARGADPKAFDAAARWANPSLERPNPSKTGPEWVREWSCYGPFLSISFPVLSLFNGLRRIPPEIFFSFRPARPLTPPHDPFQAPSAAVIAGTTLRALSGLATCTAVLPDRQHFCSDSQERRRTSSRVSCWSRIRSLNSERHGRACPGHPREHFRVTNKTLK